MFNLDRGLARIAESRDENALEEACDLAVTCEDEDGEYTDPAEAVQHGYNLAVRHPGRPVQVIKLGRGESVTTYFFVGAVPEVQARLDFLPEE